jgi:uncharacterized membrane protein
MGLFDWLSGKRETGGEAPLPAGGKPFKIAHSFNPLRLKAHKDSKLAMSVTVRNTSGSRHLVSVDLELPKGNRVGFDVNSTQKHHEERMGEVGPGEGRNFSVSVYGGPMTKPGDVPVKITAYAHYLNYSKVLEQVSKTVKLRVI